MSTGEKKKVMLGMLEFGCMQSPNRHTVGTGYSFPQREHLK